MEKAMELLMKSFSNGTYEMERVWFCSMLCMMIDNYSATNNCDPNDVVKDMLEAIKSVNDELGPVVL